MKIEISRILHNSFAIAWGILGVMILDLIPITNQSIPKELYKTFGGNHWEGVGISHPPSLKVLSHLVYLI